jgi:hypothetical protein
MTTPTERDKPASSVPERLVQSWDEFTRGAADLNLRAAPFDMYAFRGQANRTWSLAPSLTRGVSRLSLKAAQGIEREALIEFKRQAHLYLPANILLETQAFKDDEVLGWWTLMQHHRAPTRVLDWTRSPFVAAYFAVEQEPEQDGAVWCVRLPELHEAIYQKFQTGPEPPNHQPAYWKPERRPAIYFAQRARETDRMAAQQGTFSVSTVLTADHADILSDALKQPAHFFKIVIPAQLKWSFLERLVHMNVTARALFPGIDGFGLSIAEYVRMRSTFGAIIEGAQREDKRQNADQLES